LLLVCLGEATKLVPFLAPLDKEYLGGMRFGDETDTHDAWGKIVGSAPVDHLTGEMIEERMDVLRGTCSQVPPMFSAVKVGGERLYRLARRGEEVARGARPVEVKEFEALSWDSPVLRFRVRCGGGTYVRTLCHDLGKSCASAGHMTALERTAVGTFRADGALTLGGLRKVMEEQPGTLPLIPAAEALAHLPLLRVGAEEARDVRHGRPLPPPPPDRDGEIVSGRDVRLVGPEGDLVAVVSAEGPGQPLKIRRVFL
jgi:tRNA pseudouridine55 synthase